jgi:predicted ribosome quality control (RQC) complex YloA/Tae2 family protein
VPKPPSRRTRARVDDAEQHRVYGDLLKTALHLVVRGAPSVSLPDHSQPGSPMIEVPLDPALDARANLAAHFRFYRRFRDAADAIDARLAEATSRRRSMSALADELAALGDAPPPTLAQTDWDALESRLRALGWRPPSQPKPSRAKQPPALPYRRFTAADGSLILVGRSAADNDKLTLRHGRAGDLWLHARDVPGSHVLLRPPPGHEPTSEALLDAATLAAWHSQSRGEPTIDVTWTERKHVRKAPGAPAGRVTLSRGRTLPVRVESERIDRLYQTLQPENAR